MEKNVRNDEIVLYGTRWCYDALQSVQIFKRQGVPYRWIDIDVDPEGCKFVKTVNGGMKSVPTILFPDGDILIEPSNDELVEKLKLIFS
jgi:glutaredoxin